MAQPGSNIAFQAQPAASEAGYVLPLRAKPSGGKTRNKACFPYSEFQEEA